MRTRLLTAAIVAAALAFTTLPVLAQHGGGGGSGMSGDRMQQMDRDFDRDFDRDRIQDRDRLDADQDRDRDRDRIHQDGDMDQDRDRVRDRIHLTDPAAMTDEEIYGSELMTAEERNRYRNELRQLATVQEREKYQARHEAKMQERARTEGKDLVPPGQGPVYGGELMTVQERNQYREKLRTLGSEEEKQKFMAEHREEMRLRAEAVGEEVEEAE